MPTENVHFFRSSSRTFSRPSTQVGHGFILNDIPLGPVAQSTRLISRARLMAPCTSHLSPSPHAPAISSWASALLVQHLPTVTLPSADTTWPLQDSATASDPNAVVATSSASAPR